MQHKYFAASNSAHGFVNYYPDVFSRADFLYIIKGGPGTGKSSFMKRQARLAESEGGRCEYYYCSSDPSSLDGVLIFTKNGAVGFLDGTAPHISEPKFPGAREEIINLGECWDTELLRKQRNEIIALSERKSGEYKSSYTFLRSVGNLRAVIDGLLEDTVNRQKMRTAVGKLVRELPKGELRAIPAVLDSVSMSGRIRLESFEKNAERLYVISEFYGVGEMLLDELFKSLTDCGVTVRVSYDPICPEHIDGIFIEEERLAFVTGRGLEEKYCSETESDNSAIFVRKTGNLQIEKINAKRFVNTEKLRELRGELRYTARLAQSSLDGALHSLSKAKIYHFLLEDIYGNAMDWKKLEAMSQRLV